MWRRTRRQSSIKNSFMTRSNNQIDLIKPRACTICLAHWPIVLAEPTNEHENLRLGQPVSRRIRTPLFARNFVSTSHPLAAQAGLRMLLEGRQRGRCRDRRGGHHRAGRAGILRSGRRLLRHRLGRQAAARPECLRRGAGRLERRLLQAQVRHGADGLANQPKRGWDAVTVPGVVAGWATLHEKLGKLPFEQLFEPGDRDRRARHAVRRHRGPAVGCGRRRAEGPAGLRPGLHAATAARPRWASTSRIPDAARTLRRIADSGGATSTKAIRPRRSPPSAKRAAAR